MNNDLVEWLEWLESLLKGGIQRGKIGRFTLKVIEVTSGVPFLFNLPLNGSYLKSSSCLLFADDLEMCELHLEKPRLKNILGCFRQEYLVRMQKSRKNRCSSMPFDDKQRETNIEETKNHCSAAVIIFTLPYATPVLFEVMSYAKYRNMYDINVLRHQQFLSLCIHGGFDGGGWNHWETMDHEN